MSIENSSAKAASIQVSTDILLHLLKYVSETLLEDVQNVQPSDSILPYLDQYAQLNLVCRSFHRLLSHDVLVDGVLLRERLAQAQISHFKSFLAWYKKRNRPCLMRYEGSIGPPKIMKDCGYVWKNPLFPR